MEETCLTIVYEIKSVGIFSKDKLYCHDMKPGKFYPKPAIYWSVAMAILKNIKIFSLKPCLFQKQKYIIIHKLKLELKIC